MCGIAAILDYKRRTSQVDREELRSMCLHMEARGPDGFGEWYSEDGSVAFGHRRLSIIDLSDRATQPMSSRDGRYTITFNGEIYNYKELRPALENKGYEFTSDSDTEVLLYLYADLGTAMFGLLRGMFAFAIYDSLTRNFLIARDPYGIKPLYYSDNGSCVRLASQVKAIVAGGKVSTSMDPAAVVGFLTLGSVPEPFTIRKDIRSLSAGSYAIINEHGMSEPVRYFSVAGEFKAAAAGPADCSTEEAFGIVADSLRRTVDYHMVADVPVGAFLSAGKDSTALVGLVGDTGRYDLNTVTLAFEEFHGKANDESPLAEEAARYYQTRHTTRLLRHTEFSGDVSHILAAMDQPSIDGINTYFVSKAAKELGWKVALSGLGGDEMFGGYNTFQDVPKWVRQFSLPSKVPLLGDAFRTLYSAVLQNKLSRSAKAAGILKYGGTYPGAYFLRRGLFMPWELSTIIDRDIVEEGIARLNLIDLISGSMQPDPVAPFGRVAALEAGLYMKNQLLRDSDWAGMAHSIELRVPLVDAFLLKELAPVLLKFAPEYQKRLLTDSPKKKLPANILSRPKTGFFVPMQSWLESDNSIDAWKSIPSLSKDGCPWARRWAYSVLEHQKTSVS